MIFMLIKKKIKKNRVSKSVSINKKISKNIPNEEKILTTEKSEKIEEGDENEENEIQNKINNENEMAQKELISS